jgi:hypothetical protein
LNKYSKETSLGWLHTFKIVQEIEQCCTLNKYGDIQAKLEILGGALEGVEAGSGLIEMVKDNLEAVKIMRDGPSSAERVRKLCGNLVDAWINEVLKSE